MMAILGNHRRFSLLVTAGLLTVASAFGWLGTRPEMSGDAAVHMRRAAAYYDSVVVLSRADDSSRVDPATTIALGYLERLRLGLGSPFRLADFALSDPRLDDSTRSRVAWAILARLRRGDAYVIDPSVGSAVDARSAGAAQLALIQRTIESTHDARAGELTVRLAYALAAGERTVGDQGDAVATQVAALLRDRALAQADLRDLLRDADARHVDPLAELQRSRAQFASMSVNAEALAGEYGLLAASGDTARTAGTLAVVAAATALRAMAQEEPWFAGSPAPSVADLRAEFGLAGVAFDRSVRHEWQPYYLRMIGTSLRDMQRVLGGLSVAGLRIAIGESGLPDTI